MTGSRPRQSLTLMFGEPYRLADDVRGVITLSGKQRGFCFLPAHSDRVSEHHLNLRVLPIAEYRGENLLPKREQRSLRIGDHEPKVNGQGCFRHDS